MISHAKISRHRRMFKTLTGLSTEGFKQILPSFEEAWKADLDRRDARRVRRRRRGGERKGRLADTADRLVFILVYFRLYPIQAVQSLLFGMSQPQANEWVHRLTPFLNAALGHQQQLPARQPRDLEAVLTQIVASASLLERRINIDLTRHALRKVVPELPPEACLEIPTVMEVVGSFFKLQPEALASRSRRHEVLVPRQLAMYLCCHRTQASVAEIAKAFGRTHPAVRNAVRRVEKRTLQSASSW